MKAYKKYNYSLELLSNVILSPRESLCYLKDVDVDETEGKIGEKQFKTDDIRTNIEDEKKTNINIIYPFYQYGQYQIYNPDDAEYYIPGSSIKGAICQGNENTQLMVDDIVIGENRKSIMVENLYKVQNIKNEQKKVKIEPFFKNVGIEMLQTKTKWKGELFYSGNDLKSILKNSQSVTKTKLCQMQRQIDNIIQTNSDSSDEDDLNTLRVAKEKLRSLKEKNIILLGGYKGLAHSMRFPKQNEELSMVGGIYLDIKTSLPYGIVEINFE